MEIIREVKRLFLLGRAPEKKRKCPLYLQEYIFVPLDLFREKLHNKNIETELEAWLGFLAFHNLERIWEISRFDPIFEGMYHDLSEYRRDTGANDPRLSAVL